MNTSHRLSDEAFDYIGKYRKILAAMIDKMTCAPLTGSISHNFIVQMIPHHRAAIEMSENLLKYNINNELKPIAENIISEQEKSISDMESALQKCSELENSRRDLCLYQRCFWEITQRMFSEMESARETNNISVNFMLEMIPHHKGAIRMSENALRFDICSGLHPILDSIIVSQKRGVCEMENLLCAVCLRS